MSNETYVTVIGNLTSDPELRFTPSGVAVVSFTVASTPRQFDRQSGKWKDGEALFMRCSLWRDAAENVADSLHKGSRVVVYGRLVQQSFTARDGSQRQRLEIQAEEVAASLRYTRLTIERNSRRPESAGSDNRSQNSQQGTDWDNAF